MMTRDTTRAAIVLILVICLGVVTITAKSRDTPEAAANPSTTLVPRPSSTVDVELPTLGPTDTSDTTSSSTATTDSGATSIASTTIPDPYAWLETIPVPGKKFIGVTTENGNPVEVAAFAAAAERTPDAVMISRDWASATPDIATIEQITASGHLPIMAWEPWDHAVKSSFNRRRGEQPDYSLATIIDGEHDEFIAGWADALAEWGRPVAIRFAHEMNGFWYPWSESVNGNSSGQYVAAWRHVHDIFTEAGATNVIWIWSPNPIDPSLTDVSGLYPGDDYVDWVGVVGYLGNGIDPSVYVPTFDQLFGPTIDEVRALTDLPLVLTELGATEDGGKKAGWMTHVIDTIVERDDIIGFIWFEVDKETDWRIVSSEEARLAFVEATSDPVFDIPR